MAEVDNNKKPWSIPDIYSLSFKKTEGGFYDGTYEDVEYIDMDPSGGLEG